MRPCFLLLTLMIGCGKPAEPPAVEPDTTPAPAVPDEEKLEAILKPTGWHVNDLDQDVKPRIVSAPIVRSRIEKKTDADFAKLSKALEETGIPVIIDLGGWQGTPATEAWLKHISGNRMVVGLRLSKKLDAKKVVAEVAKMTWLELLEINGEGLDDADFKALAPLQKLKSLQMAGTQSRLTRASYTVLSGMKELRAFDLGLSWNYTGPTGAADADYAILAGLPKLESLAFRIDPRRSTDAGLAQLKTLTHLKTLTLELGYDVLSGPRTTAYFDAIAGMADLEELNLNLVAPSEAYEKLAALKKLKKLKFLAGGLIAGEPLAKFTPHVGRIASIERLDAGKPDEWTNEALADIRGLTNLRLLDLGLSKVTDDGLKHLSEMKELDTLWCRANPVTGSGLKHLAGLPKLRFVSLSMGAASDEGLSSIPPLPALEVLELRKTNITDRAIDHLAKLPKLRSLDVAETGVTDAAIPVLKQFPALAYVELENTKITPAGAADLTATGKVKLGKSVVTSPPKKP